MTLKNNRAPLQCYFKLCAWFLSHWWIKTGVTVRKRPIWVKIRQFLEPRDLEIWRMTFKTNRAPLLSNIKLYASFHHHMWIQTGVTVRKRLSWVVTLTFDLWPWPFAWTLLWSLVITPDNFMMILWWQHSQNVVTDRHTDGQMEKNICRAAWSQLKTIGHLSYATSSFVHYFVAISGFKLEIQSGNAQFGSKSTIFRAVWPCNLMYDLEKQ